MKKSIPALILLCAVLFTLPGLTCGSKLPGPDSHAATPGAADSHLLPPILHLLFSGRGGISGLIWYDLDGDGAPDGEPGATGIRVFVDIDRSGTYTPGDPSAVSGTDGTYVIEGLKQGNYLVYIDSLPPGYTVTTINPLPVKLDRYQIVTDADYGIQDRSGTISGHVFNDSNQDGIIDPGEAGVGNVMLYWDMNDNDDYDPGEPMAMTAPVSGFYRISDLPAGAHKLHLLKSTLPPEYYQGTVSGHNPTLLSLTAGEQASVNLGYVKAVTVTGFLLDSDTAFGWSGRTVFIDLNGNGIYDPGEPIAITDENGMFTFANLLPGTYTIHVLETGLPSGHSLVAGSFVRTGAEGETIYVNFLTWPQPVTLNGTVWNDINGNGGQDPGEAGLPGVTVFADTNDNTSPDPGEPSAVTDASGAYTLILARHGPNRIRVDPATVPPNSALTTGNIPLSRIFVPGETFTRARFGYQDALAVLHANDYPNQIAGSSDNHFYVSNPRTNSVFIYDSAWNLTGEIKGIGRPLGVAVNSGGEIFVGNGISKNIDVYSATGNLLDSFGNKTIQMANDIAFDRDDNVYVVDSVSAVVWVYAADGTFMGNIGSKGPGTDQFRFPVALAVHYRMAGAFEVAELYVADQGSHLIKVFDLQGNFLRSFGGPIQTTMSGTVWQGLFSAVQSLAFDSSGMLHALDMNLDVIQILDPVTGTYSDFYYAYLLPNHGRLNLQLDLLITSANESIITNVATGAIEVLEKANTPPSP